MKRLIAAGVLLGLVLTAYFGGYFYIKNTCERAENILEECINAYETQKNAETETEKLKKFWDKKEKPLSIFADHSDIDAIEQAIMTLKVYSESDEQELFNQYYQNLKILLHQLLEDTVLSIHSVM